MKIRSMLTKLGSIEDVRPTSQGSDGNAKRVAVQL